MGAENREIARPPKRVTIRDLARELGMSDRAVSQALNPRESNVKLSPDTVARIQKLAEERNYRPHTSAQAMRSGRFFNLGYFEAKTTSTAFPLRGSDAGIYDAAARANYRVVLIKLPSDTSKAHNPIPSVFREAHLDTLVVSNVGSLTPECKEAIDASGLPVVYLNEKKDTNAVYVDDFGGAREITKHHLAQGRKRIVYLHTLSDAYHDIEHYSVQDRIRGYEAAMREAGRAPQVIRFHNAWEDELSAWLEANRDVDAIITPGDFAAVRIFRALHGNPLKIPSQLAISGYGDDFSELSPVPLTTMFIPFYEMGAAATEMAIQLVNRAGTLPSQVFQTHLIVRDSTPQAG